MEWQAVGTITTSSDYVFTPVITGTLFKLKHINQSPSKSKLKIAIRQAFDDNGSLALYDYKLIQCKAEQDIILFSLPKGLINRKLAFKRADNYLDQSWVIEIEQLDIIEDGVSLPISISDVTSLQEQLNSIQAELTLKALDLEFDDHVFNTNNPHSVTADQLNAEVVGTADAAINAHATTVNHPVVDGTTKGMMSSADKNKLNGIASSATSNESNAYLLSRVNHSGLQAIATIADLTIQLASKQPTISILPIANGGTGSDNKNFVDLTTNQTINGIKTFQSNAYPGFIIKSSDPVATRLRIDSNTNTNVGFDIGHAGVTKWSVVSYKVNPGDAFYSFSFFNAETGQFATGYGDAFFIKGGNSFLGFGTNTPGCRAQFVGGVTVSNSAVASSDPGAGNLNITGVYNVAGTPVIGSRKTAWGTPTGLLNRTTFDPATATAIDIGQRLAALIIDLRSHGLIGN